jgi:hypothetical protein
MGQRLERRRLFIDIEDKVYGYGYGGHEVCFVIGVMMSGEFQPLYSSESDI